MKKQILSEEFKRMQKLAGILAEYQEDIKLFIRSIIKPLAPVLFAN